MEENRNVMTLEDRHDLRRQVAYAVTRINSQAMEITRPEAHAVFMTMELVKLASAFAGHIHTRITVTTPGGRQIKVVNGTVEME